MIDSSALLIGSLNRGILCASIRLTHLSIVGAGSLPIDKYQFNR